MGETFGRMLRRHREALAGPPTKANRYEGARLHQSIHRIAARAEIDPSYLCLLERGERVLPYRDKVERLAVALELDAFDTAALLVAAGYWPWPALDGDSLRDVLLTGQQIATVAAWHAANGEVAS